MNVKIVTLYTIQMPLKTPFSTHLGTVSDREAIIIEIIDSDGRKGYGEVVAFSSPWYTEETIKTCHHILVDFLLPLLQKEKITHPKEASLLFNQIKGNNMAKAGVEMALWDLQAKKEGVSLASYIGGKRRTIHAGIAIGATSKEEMLRQIDTYMTDGYKRLKIKINPENDYEYLSFIRNHFPDVPLMADANSAYTLDHLQQLQALDDFNLVMIEQPFTAEDFVDHATLQRHMRTPICLDEGIASFNDARQAVALGSCEIINIKIARVGGIAVAKKIHDFCMAHNIQVWCGGMLEFGISRAHNIALATMEGFTIPGDISATSRYWDEDITTEEVIVENGQIEVPTKLGIGFEMNERRLQEVTVCKETVTFE